MPFIPEWKNVKIFLLGLLWCCLGGIGPAVYEIWESRNYGSIDWIHVRNSTAIGVAPMALGYWRKYRALIAPPPNEKGQER